MHVVALLIMTIELRRIVSIDVFIAYKCLKEIQGYYCWCNCATWHAITKRGGASSGEDA